MDKVLEFVGEVIIGVFFGAIIGSAFFLAVGLVPVAFDFMIRSWS